MNDTELILGTEQQRHTSEDNARLAEYEALRSESDRSAQLLSNAVWVGVTGFGLTIIGGATAVSSAPARPLMLPAVALLLGVQSVAITTVYASELWKYVRVGAYIRVYIEAYYRSRWSTGPPPMQWEIWIRDHRAKFLHIAALAFLQAPIGAVCAAGILIALVHCNCLNLAGSPSLRYLSYLTGDMLLGVLLSIVIVVDAVLMMVLWRNLRRADRGEFGSGDDSLKALSTLVHR